MSKLSGTNFGKKTASPLQKPKPTPKSATAVKSSLQKIQTTSPKNKVVKSTENLLQRTQSNVQKDVTIAKSTETLTQKEQSPSPSDTSVVKSTENILQRDIVSPPNCATVNIVYEEVVEKTQFEKQKEKQSELIQKVNKKAAEYQSSKPSSGVFTEVVTHGAFTSRTAKSPSPKIESPTPPRTNGTNGSKSFLGFPSSANDLALDAKSDLETDENISNEVKEKVIEKLFALVSMVQHVYESKVRIMTEFEKFKDTHLKNELRREKEHSEQLYKLNMNFQNEVVQAVQRLKSELDISRTVSQNVEESNNSSNNKDSSIDFNTSEEIPVSVVDEKVENSLENISEPNTMSVEVENVKDDVIDE